VTVALSADAGDELFAGYSKYDSIFRYRKKIQSIPNIFRKSLAPFAALIAQLKFGDPAFSTRYQKLSLILKTPSVQQLMLNSSKLFDDKTVLKLLNKKVKLLTTHHDSCALSISSLDELNYMLAVDYQTYLSDDILQKVDRASMSVSLEAREPLLDQHIIEWAARLPTEMKYKNGEKKYILKQIVHKYLPESLMERPKMGFAIPINSWLKKDIRIIVEDSLNTEILKRQSIFNEKYIENIKNRFYNGENEFSVQLWYVLMFQMWYERWMK